jgi:hypothetical protein
MDPTILFFVAIFTVSTTIVNVQYFLSFVYAQVQTKTTMMSNKTSVYSNHISRNNLTTTESTISQVQFSASDKGRTIVQSWQETNPFGEEKQIVAAQSSDGGRTYSKPFVVSTITSRNMMKSSSNITAKGDPPNCFNPRQASTINEVYIIYECIVAQTGHTDIFASISKNGSFSPSIDISQDPKTDSTQLSIQTFSYTKPIATWLEIIGPQQLKSYCWRC